MQVYMYIFLLFSVDLVFKVPHTTFFSFSFQKAMIQFAWHDGSTKNIHVDMTQLFEYQKQLREIVQLYERRVDWLASGSRRIFGTLVEKK